MADTIVTVCGIIVIICGILSIRSSIQYMRYSRLTVKLLKGEPLTAKEQKLLRETLTSYRKEEE